MSLRNYNNTSVPQTLTDEIDNSQTGLTVGDNTSYPTPPFTLGLERGTPNQEVVLCTSTSSTTGFVVTRGYNGSPQVTHPEGASVELTSAAIDYAEANVFINLLQDVGDLLTIGGSGAQALGVGADGTALTANSSDSTGLSWQQPVPTGVIAFTASSSAPTGWVKAQGQSLSTTNPLYENLFGAIGYTYGGSGGNFNVPNLTGRFPMGVDGGSYPLASSGGSFGPTSITLGDDQLPTHSHGNTVAIGGTPVTTEIVVYDPESTIKTVVSGSGFGVSYTTTPSLLVTIENTGSGDAFDVDILNPYLALTPIIKL